MKINKEKSNKKIWLFAAIAVAAVLFIAGIAYLYYSKASIFGWTPFPASQGPIDYNPPTKEQIDAGNKAKTDTITNDGKKPAPDTTTSPKTPAQGEQTTEPSAPSSQIPMSITAAGQNGATAQIRVLIETVTSSGQCTLTLTKDGRTVTKTASVEALANSSTCRGFDVPVSELAPGTWNATVKYKNSSAEATASRQIAIQ